MIPVVSLLYKIDQRLNKLSSNEHQGIPLEDKILLIREAELKLIKQKVSGSPQKKGLDSGKKRYQDLENLIESPEDHELIPVEVNKTLNRWSVSLTDLKPSLFFYIDAYLLADKGDCKNSVVWVNPDLVGHGNINTLLQNAHYRPSFEYQETFSDITGDELGVYTDGSFTPRKLYLSYLRYPTLTDAEGYEDFDGKASEHRDSELSLQLEDELLDIIIADLALYTENPSAYQGAVQNKATSE